MGTIQSVFDLPVRQAEGFLESLFIAKKQSRFDFLKPKKIG
jgi:hypothetical protein